MHYVIYCDESGKTGRYFGNFYGGAIISSKDADQIIKKLEDKKKSLNLLGEVKWSKVTPNYLTKYMELIDLFFQFIALNQVKIRIMFTHNYFPAKNLTQEQKDDEFFILYYQFFKNAFGIQYCNDTSLPIGLKVYFDKLPDTDEKNTRFKQFIYELQFREPFNNANVFIRQEDITEIDSKKHVILQCTDVILGSMYFRLNDLHKEKPPGQWRRGKRTIAKESLYKHINTQIRKIYPNFNIGESTGLKGDVRNQWYHPYRHWKFVPNKHDIDPTKAKHKK